MRTVAGLLNIVLGVAVGVGFAVVINFGAPVDIAAWVICGLFVLAGIGIMTRAPWGAALGQWLGVGGILLGLAMLVGGGLALVTVPDWGGLVSGVMGILGAAILVASALAFVANRRAKRIAAEA